MNVRDPVWAVLSIPPKIEKDMQPRFQHDGKDRIWVYVSKEEAKKQVEICYQDKTMWNWEVREIGFSDRCRFD